MGKAYLSQFNMRDFKGAENINIQIGYQPSDYITDLATANSNNIYLYQDAPSQHNYTISTEDVNDDMLYLNRNMSSICMGLTNLQHTDLINKQKVNYNLVINLHTSFANCFRLAGAPISSKYTQSMYGTFYNCSNLVGVPQVNANVNNLIGAFYNCQNITGQPNINSNVRMAIDTYYQCDNLIGSPASEVPAVSIARMYYGCDNIAGSPSNINNALITTMAYYDCSNIYGTFYWDTNGIDQASAVNAYNMFYGRDTSNYLNIYVRPNQCILNALVNYPSTYGAIYGTPLIWTEHTDANGFPYYTNDSYKTNIYCDYNIIRINSFSINELEGKCNGYLHDYEYNINYTYYSDYVTIYNNAYKNYYVNYYIPRWAGFTRKKPIQYEEKISLNALYDISLYKVINAIDSKDLLREINTNYEREWHTDRNYTIKANVTKLNLYYFDYYIYINNYQLNELYFYGSNNYSIFMALKPLDDYSNILSDLQFLNIEYQNNYSKIDGFFGNVLLYPLESNNTLNMTNSFQRLYKYGYTGSIYNFRNEYISSRFYWTLYNFYPYNQSYPANILSDYILGYYITQRNNTKIIPICSQNVISLNNTYRNTLIFGDAISGSNVLYMHGTYANSTIDNNIYCGEKVRDFTGCYMEATSSNPITVCGSNVIEFTTAYDSYRCYQDGETSGLGHEITINIGPNVINARYSYYNTYINIDNIIFAPNLVNAHNLYGECKTTAINPLPSLILPPNLVNLSHCFYNIHNINNLSNFIITHDVNDMSSCFYGLNLIQYPLNLNNYNIQGSAASMYSGCSNLVTIGDINNVHNNTAYMFYRCNLNWEKFANQNNIIIKSSNVMGMFMDASMKSKQYDFDINIKIQDEFDTSLVIKAFLRGLNTTKNIYLDVNGYLSTSSSHYLYDLLEDTSSDILYLNFFQDYINNIISSADDYSGFLYNCSFNNIISNKPLMISQSFSSSSMNGTPMFWLCNINNLVNIYLKNITSESLRTLNGIHQINFCETATLFTINNYYTTYTWNEATSITDLYFQHHGVIFGGEYYYPRSRSINFNFGYSNTIGYFSNFNFILDFSKSTSTEKNSISINFNGYMNGLTMGKQHPLPYIFDTLGDTTNLDCIINWQVNKIFNTKQANYIFRFTNSLINMNYTLRLLDFTNYVREDYYNYSYNRLDGMFYYSYSNQDEYLQNLYIRIDDGISCPYYIFLYSNLSFNLLNLNYITVSTYQDYEHNTIKFANKFINTPSILNNFQIDILGAINTFNLFSLNHISTIFQNSNYQSINNLYLKFSGFQYNFSRSKEQPDDDVFPIISQLKETSWSALNNFTQCRLDIDNITSSYGIDGDCIQMDSIWRSIFKILNTYNSQIVFNTSHIPCFYNDFANCKINNIFNFITDCSIENFTYKQPRFHCPYTGYTYNTQNTWKNSYLINSNLYNMTFNYLYAEKNILYNKWKNINLYGFFGNNFHNTTITFDYQVNNNTCCTYISDTYGQTFSLFTPVSIFYLYNNNFISNNGKMFGDLTWDQIQNTMINSNVTSGYINNIYQLTYYNSGSNVTIKFNIETIIAR